MCTKSKWTGVIDKLVMRMNKMKLFKKFYLKKVNMCVLRGKQIERCVCVRDEQKSKW